MDSKHYEKIIVELSECRQDERDSQTQCLQAVSIAAAVFVLIFSLFFDNDGGIYKKLFKEVYLMSLMLFSFIVCYISYLGINNVMRFHYIRYLESELTMNEANGIIHWMSYSSIINTKNVKNIFKTKYSLISYICYSLTLFLALFFCAYMLYAEAKIFELNNKFYFAFPFVLLSIPIFVFIYVSLNSKKIAKLAYSLAYKRLYSENFNLYISDLNIQTRGKLKSTLSGILYFLYPKAKDFQKILFVVGGYLTGIFLVNGANNYLVALRQNLMSLILSVIVIDVLLYQSRFHLNDIRGIKEDIAKLNATGSTSNFLAKNQTIKKMVKITLSVIILKIFIAIFLNINYGKSMMFPMIVMGISLFLITVLYETARTKKYNKLVLFTVTLGYPFRFLSGLWCAVPNLFTTATLYNGSQINYIVLFLYIGTLAAIGGYSAYIPWLYEATEQNKTGKSIKSHYNYLYQVISDRYKEFQRDYSVNCKIKRNFPLYKKGKISDCWILAYLLSMLFLALMLVISQPFYWILLFCRSCNIIFLV